MFHKTNF